MSLNRVKHILSTLIQVVVVLLLLFNHFDTAKGVLTVFLLFSVCLILVLLNHFSDIFSSFNKLRGECKSANLHFYFYSIELQTLSLLPHRYAKYKVKSNVNPLLYN